MWLSVLILIIVAAALVGFGVSKRNTGGKAGEEIPTYTCPDCGKYHCDCYVEKRNGGKIAAIQRVRGNYFECPRQREENP